MTAGADLSAPDLIDRLTAAAGAAINAERPSLSRGPGAVRGVTIDLAINSAGQISEAVAFVERRLSGPELAGRERRDHRGVR